jgi:transcriptional regulator with XRE-family HTH domain
VEELAHTAGVSRNSIGYFERGQRATRPETLAAIIGALEAAGIEFTTNDPGVRLRRKEPP